MDITQKAVKNSTQTFELRITCTSKRWRNKLVRCSDRVTESYLISESHISFTRNSNNIPAPHIWEKKTSACTRLTWETLRCCLEIYKTSSHVTTMQSSSKPIPPFLSASQGSLTPSTRETLWICETNFYMLPSHSIHAVYASSFQ